MKYYLITCRSVTHAQRVVAALDHGGVHGNITRVPKVLADAGCGYAVRISARDEHTAAKLLHSTTLKPVRVFADENGAYREVRHGLS
ncbi:MAG: DUF3343 domain-containing protein [Oscillospiraceae bacterium]|nr:DUF3343 domain-containing protein [Oscillospiraceae bacterium]